MERSPVRRKLPIRHLENTLDKAIDSVEIAATESFEPKVLSRPEHSLSRRDLSTEAIKVLYRLHRSGYQSFLVGGSVRDLLLGRRPKDFDIATNARPQEVRRLFRNSRIIGRRFRLVHVFFRSEIVEVATFRASPEAPESPEDWVEAEEEATEAAVAEPPQLAPQEETVYGSPSEDARRRDFTVNAMFYNIADFSIIDYVGGIDDLVAKRIRTIGDPDCRFQEDPVRMMRALEYGERLGFQIEQRASEGISRQHKLIADASAPRLTYELLEGLRSGSAADIFGAWGRAGLVKYAYPDLPYEKHISKRILESVDAGIGAGRFFPDSSLIGSHFLPLFFGLVKDFTGENGRVNNLDLLARLRTLLEPAGASMHLSNHTMHLIQQGLFTLTKMRRSPERGRQVIKLVRQGYFPVAWDLHRFATVLGYIPEEAHRGWAGALRKVGEKKYREDAKTLGEKHPQSRQHRPRRRRRR